MWVLWSALVVGLLIVLWAVFSLKERRPDQLLLVEKRGHIRPHLKRWYWGRSVLALPATIRTISTEVKAQARGKIDVVVRLSVSFFPDPKQVQNLIRVGGWRPDAVDKVASELAGTVQGLTGELVEQMDITEVTREKLGEALRNRLSELGPNLGVTVTSVVVSAAEAADKKIADAIRQKEEARIQEETERANQQARIAREKLRLKADDTIARMKHETEMAQLALKEAKELTSAELEQKILEKEAEKKRLNLELEKEEVALLAKNPELLMLAPQLSRLVEASQQLKNARTVITLSPEIYDGLPKILQTVLDALQKNRPETAR